MAALVVGFDLGQLLDQVDEAGQERPELFARRFRAAT